ncbi:MAG: GTPase HflX [Chloroflexi bacterium]|nr:GTPase HflX [Chloroflexota bacterium]
MDESLEELKMLAETAGIEVVGQAVQNTNRINPSTFIGSGKAVEIKEEMEGLKAQVLVFDDELSPRHQRELEEIFGEDTKILDRSALILDIFAQHARTHEGRLQVELAQYEYRLPRLTRAWTHLARQAGGGAARGGVGVGLRGPGETQLEVDRREIGDRITKLNEEIEKVRAHRQRHREQRNKTGMPIIALVGYTNAGKSTLMNALSGSDVYVANQLFATLDTTTRRIELPSGRAALLSDTVGFIQKLPTTLIAAFRATLEGIIEADLILHVVDINNPHAKQHIETVEDTLAAIETPDIPQILVLNKIDLLDEPVNPLDYFSDDFKSVVRVSAVTKQGLDVLLAEIEGQFKSAMSRYELLLPYNKGDVVAWVHENAIVEAEDHTEEGFRLTVNMPPRVAGNVKEFIIDSPEVDNSTSLSL